MSCVGERLRWPKKEIERQKGEEDCINFIDFRDLEEGELYDSGREEGKAFHKLQVVWMNDHL